MTAPAWTQEGVPEDWGCSFGNPHGEDDGAWCEAEATWWRGGDENMQGRCDEHAPDPIDLGTDTYGEPEADPLPGHCHHGPKREACPTCGPKSPLPSDEELHGIALGVDDPATGPSPENPAKRRRVHASALRLAAVECHRRGGEDARAITAYLNELADEMEARS